MVAHSGTEIPILRFIHKASAPASESFERDNDPSVAVTGR